MYKVVVNLKIKIAEHSFDKYVHLNIASTG